MGKRIKILFYIFLLLLSVILTTGMVEIKPVSVNDGGSITDDIKDKVEENGDTYVYIPGPDLGTKIITVQVDVQMKKEGSNNIIDAANYELDRWQKMIVNGDDGGLDLGKSLTNIGKEVIKELDPIDAAKLGVDALTGNLTDDLLNYQGRTTGTGGGISDEFEVNLYSAETNLFDKAKKYSVDYISNNMFYIYEDLSPYLKNNEDGTLYNVKEYKTVDNMKYEYIQDAGRRRPVVLYIPFSGDTSNDPEYYSSFPGYIPAFILDPEKHTVTPVSTIKTYAKQGIDPVTVKLRSGETVKFYVRSFSGSAASQPVVAESTAQNTASVIKENVPNFKVSDNGNLVYYNYEFGFNFREHEYEAQIIDRSHLIVLKDGYPWMVNNDDFEMKYLFPAQNQPEEYFRVDMNKHYYEAEVSDTGYVVILRDGFPWAISNGKDQAEYLFLRDMSNTGGPLYQAVGSGENGSKDKAEVSLVKYTENGPSIRLLPLDSRDNSWVLTDNGHPSVVFTKSEDGKSYDTSYVSLEKPSSDAKPEYFHNYDPKDGQWKSDSFYIGGDSAPVNNNNVNDSKLPELPSANIGSELDLIDIARQLVGSPNAPVKIGDTLYIDYEGSIDLNKLTVEVNEQGYPVIRSEDKIYTIEVRKEGVNAEKDTKGKITPHVIITDKKTGVKYDSVVLTDPKTGKKSEVVHQYDVDPSSIDPNASVYEYAGDVSPLFNLPDVIPVEIDIDYPLKNMKEHGNVLVKDALKDIVGEVQSYGTGGGVSDEIGRGGGKDADANEEDAVVEQKENENKQDNTNRDVSNNSNGLTTDFATMNLITLPEAILETTRTFAAQALFGEDADASDWGGGKAAGRGGGVSDSTAIGVGRGGGNDNSLSITDKTDITSKPIKVYTEVPGGFLNLGKKIVEKDLNTFASPNNIFYVAEDGTWNVNLQKTGEGSYTEYDLSTIKEKYPDDYNFAKKYIATDWNYRAHNTDKSQPLIDLDREDGIFGDDQPTGFSDDLYDGAIPFYVYDTNNKIVDLAEYSRNKYNPDDSFRRFLSYEDYIVNHINDKYADTVQKYPEFASNVMSVLNGTTTCEELYSGQYAGQALRDCNSAVSEFSDESEARQKREELKNKIINESIDEVFKKHGIPEGTNLEDLNITQRYSIDADLKKTIDKRVEAIEGATPKPEDKYKYLFKPKEEQEELEENYKPASKWPILDSLQQALSNIVVYLFEPQQLAREIANKVFNVTSTVALSLVPLAIMLAILVMMKYGASSPAGIANVRSSLINLMIAIGLTISSKYIIDKVFELSTHVANQIIKGEKYFELNDTLLGFAGEDGGFVSFLFSVLIVFLLLLLIAEVYIASLAMQVQYVAINAYSPFMLIMSAYEPMAHMKNDWFKRLVHAMIIAPSNAIVLRIMHEASKSFGGGSSLATAIIFAALYLGCGSIMVVINASVIKDMFGGIAALAQGAISSGKSMVNGATNGYNAAKWAGNTRVGQAVRGGISKGTSAAKDFLLKAGSGSGSVSGAAALAGATAGAAGLAANVSKRMNPSTHNAFTGYQGNKGSNFSGLSSGQGNSGQVPTPPIFPQSWKPSGMGPTNKEIKSEAARIGKEAADKSGHDPSSQEYKNIQRKAEMDALKDLNQQKTNIKDQAAKMGIEAANKSGYSPDSQEYKNIQKNAEMNAFNNLKQQQNDLKADARQIGKEAADKSGYLPASQEYKAIQSKAETDAYKDLRRSKNIYDPFNDKDGSQFRQHQESMMQREASRIGRETANNSGLNPSSDAYKQLQRNTEQKAMSDIRAQAVSYNSANDPHGRRLSEAQQKWSGENQRYEISKQNYAMNSQEAAYRNRPLEPTNNFRNSAPYEFKAGTKDGSNFTNIPTQGEIKERVRSMDTTYALSEKEIDSISYRANNFMKAGAESYTSVTGQRNILHDINGSSSDGRLTNFADFAIGVAMHQVTSEERCGTVYANVPFISNGMKQAINYNNGANAPDLFVSTAGAANYFANHNNATMKDIRKAGEAALNNRTFNR